MADAEWVQVDDNRWVYRRRDKAAARRSHGVMSDIEPFVSPIDKTLISSRSQVREHEKKHNVYQIGNDWCGREKPAFWDQIKR